MIAPRRPGRLLLVYLFLAVPCVAAAEVPDASPEESLDEYVLFPADEFFDPLVADLRWPRFSASHQWRLGTDDFDRVAQVSFGESFAFVQSPEYDWGAGSSGSRRWSTRSST